MKIFWTRYWTQRELKEYRWNPNPETRRWACRILANNGKPHLFWSRLYQGYYEDRLLEV